MIYITNPEVDGLRSEIGRLRGELDGHTKLLATILRQHKGRIIVDKVAFSLCGNDSIERIDLPETNSIMYRLRLEPCPFRHPDGVCSGTGVICGRSPSMECFK